MVVDEDGILTPEEQALLKKVKRSQVWRLVMDALCYERELLFGGNSSISGLNGLPDSTERLWKIHGAILLIQHLLQEGPQLVIWYRRHMDALETAKQERRAGKDATVEREYAPGETTDGLHEPPSFDL
jgi:hypothetical protein